MAALLPRFINSTCHSCRNPTYLSCAHLISNLQFPTTFLSAKTSMPPDLKSPPTPRSGPRAHARVLLVATLVAIALFHAASHLATSGSPTSLASLASLLSPVDYQRVVTAEDPVGDKIGAPTLNPDTCHRRLGAKAMVVADVPLCAAMGRDILRQGGNAADAAVTVALCIGSVNLHLSGIGGGGFIVTSRGNETLSIDAREMAPALAHKHMYDGVPLLSQFGGLAVAVPGELAGLHELYVRHGSGNLLWAQLFAPVIELNRRGWAAPEIWARAVQKIDELLLSRVPPLQENWDFIYKGPKREPVDEGDMVCRPNYADTLELVARNGLARVFYDPEGPIAPKLALVAHRLGGVITPEDFGRYEARVTPALLLNFSVGADEYELLTTGGVSSGLALIAGLNFYQAVENGAEYEPAGEPNTKGGEDFPADPLIHTHRLIEAMKWTALARSHLGDVNATYWDAIVRRYSSPKWAEALVSSGLYSDNTTFPWEHYSPLYELTEPHGTSHFSVVDEHGGAVSMTTTVNLLFGSLVYDRDTGVVLNDQMDDFSVPDQSNAFNLTPSALNFVGPGLRPLSLTSPTIVRKNGVLHLLIGAAGGSRIVTAVLQAIVRTIHHDMLLLDTIAYPRLHHQLIPEYALVEDGAMFNLEFRSQLHCILCELHHRLNHTVTESGALTAMNGIKRTLDGGWEGVADFWRKRGGAAGY